MIKSAGILAYRWREGTAEVFLVHPGGPFWLNKDSHAWSMPKGEFTDEPALAAARREFAEETGQAIDGDFVALSPVKAGGKMLHAFAVESESPDPHHIHSNRFDLEWPPNSGRKMQFPEVDRAAWVPLMEAGEKIHKNQQAVIRQLQKFLEGSAAGP